MAFPSKEASVVPEEAGAPAETAGTGLRAAQPQTPNKIIITNTRTADGRIQNGKAGIISGNSGILPLTVAGYLFG